MRVERVNDQLQELGDFGLELLFGHNVLFIIAKNGSDNAPTARTSLPEGYRDPVNRKIGSASAVVA